MNKKYIYFSLVLFIFLIDRATKIFAITYLQMAHVVNQYLTFELTFNRGISWGMFYNTNTVVFAVVSMITAIITMLLCWHAYRVYKKGNSIIGHICIIAGSFSNIIDRALYGGVIDFIVLSYKNYSWPVFNIADVAIVCGVFIFMCFDET